MPCFMDCNRSQFDLDQIKTVYFLDVMKQKEAMKKMCKEKYSQFFTKIKRFS